MSSFYQRLCLGEKAVMVLMGMHLAWEPKKLLPRFLLVHLEIGSMITSCSTRCGPQGHVARDPNRKAEHDWK